MILITGAAGKTGKSILRSFSNHGIQAKALVRSQQQADAVHQIGNFVAVIGDMRHPETFEETMKDVDQIYYICPNMAPDELEIGKGLINLSKKYGVRQFVYHSVLHPHVESMPHHWQKMRMEETLFASGLDFTILQPCAYMQNITSNLQTITTHGKYVVPYVLSSRLSILDLDDLAEVVTKIFTQNAYLNGIYELAGPEPLSQLEVANQLSNVFGHTIVAIEQSRSDWKQGAQMNGLGEEPISTLIKMFDYYDKYGLVGNPTILEYLLGRKPTTFRQLLVKIKSNGENR